MEQILSEKEIDALLQGIEDSNLSKEEKIKHLGLSHENTEKFDEVQKEADKYKEGSKEISKSFFNIKGFSFDEEGANVIAREMTRAFVRGRLEAGGFPKDKTEKAVDIIMDRKELKNQEQEKIGENQEMLEKAYEQLIKQKERFIQTLEKLEFSGKQAEDLLFMKNKIEDIEVILEIDLKTGSIGMPIIDKTEGILKKRDDLIDVLKKIDDKSFINNFEDFEKEVNQFKKIASLFFSDLKNNFNILNEIMLILRIEEESLKNNPEVSEKVSKEIAQLLDHFGYRQIYPVKDEEYDIRAHEVVGEEISEFKRGKIVKVVKRGLKRGDTIIFKAKVIIAK